MMHLNLRLLTVVGLALVFSITACKKDNDSPGESGKFSATLSSTAFQPTAVVAIEEYGFITITGYQIKADDSLMVSLDIPDTAHVNNNIPFEDGRLSYYRGKTDQFFYSYYTPSHGSTTITSWDKTSKKITGKFSGVIYVDDSKDSIVVTNGQFNTTYQ